MMKEFDQLRYESDCWNRILEYILAENSFCKNRLSDVIRRSSGEVSFMDQAEIYQHYFIQEETLIYLIKSDISVYNKLLNKIMPPENTIVNEVMPNREKISKELEKIQQEFKKMKLAFNIFLEVNTLNETIKPQTHPIIRSA